MEVKPEQIVRNIKDEELYIQQIEIQVNEEFNQQLYHSTQQQQAESAASSLRIELIAKENRTLSIDPEPSATSQKLMACLVMVPPTQQDHGIQNNRPTVEETPSLKKDEELYFEISVLEAAQFVKEDTFLDEDPGVICQEVEVISENLPPQQPRADTATTNMLERVAVLWEALNGYEMELFNVNSTYVDTEEKMRAVITRHYQLITMAYDRILEVQSRCKLDLLSLPLDMEKREEVELYLGHMQYRYYYIKWVGSCRLERLEAWHQFLAYRTRLELLMQWADSWISQLEDPALEGYEQKHVRHQLQVKCLQETMPYWHSYRALEKNCKRIILLMPEWCLQAKERLNALEKKWNLLFKLRMRK